MEEASSFPNQFWTLQVYFALSSSSTCFITRVVFSAKLILPPSTTGTPSFFQVTNGFGTPLNGHLMVIVVFEAVVTLSPMFSVTALTLPKGMSCPGSGTSITGLMGSIWVERQSQIFWVVDDLMKFNAILWLLRRQNSRFRATHTPKLSVS